MHRLQPMPIPKVQPSHSKPCLDISLSEGSKEGLFKGYNEVHLCNIEDMVSDQVLVQL
jgi:hypothetical protein